MTTIRLASELRKGDIVVRRQGGGRVVHLTVTRKPRQNRYGRWIVPVAEFDMPMEFDRGDFPVVVAK